MKITQTIKKHPDAKVEVYFQDVSGTKITTYFANDNDVELKIETPNHSQIILAVTYVDGSVVKESNYLNPTRWTVVKGK
jgi:hypothetical protein